MDVNLPAPAHLARRIWHGKGRFPCCLMPMNYSPRHGAHAGDVREAMACHGIRNALLTSIAPTGTISLTRAMPVPGIEPLPMPIPGKS